jgi:hypothetical protein
VFLFFSFIIHMCIQGLVHFSPRAPPPSNSIFYNGASIKYSVVLAASCSLMTYVCMSYLAHVESGSAVARHWMWAGDAQRCFIQDCYQEDYNSTECWFSTKGDFLPLIGHLAIFRDSFDCYDRGQGPAADI